MESLRNTLEEITLKNKRAKKLRRYIVVEAVYQILNSFGVLGKAGRGLTEFCGVLVEKIDIITAAMGHALATEGGFCTGSARVTDHQFWVRLFCFFAPISCEITAIDVLAENPDLITKLKKNITLLWKGLSGVMGLSLASNPESPIVFLKLQKSTSSVKSDLQLLNEIADCLLKDHSILAVASKRSTLDKCRLPVGIRLFVSAAHSESDLLKASESLKTVAESVLKNHI